jgi:hypothetical protein
MSSISAAGIGQSVMQYIQQLASNAQSATTSAATTSSTTTPSSTAASIATGTPAAGHKHHHHHGGSTDLEKIQDAVTNALQSAQAGGSSANPNAVIKTAIEQILAGTNNVTPPTTSTTTATPGTTTTPSTTTQSTFAQTLQSYGVDPQQFRNDFLAALQDAQNGQPVNTANIFGSFPTGTQVDTTG